MGDILADTAILANASKKEPLCSCYKHTSWMGWLLKKEGFVCQENLSTCNNSWRTVLSFRLPLSLQCVFDNKLTPFISGNWFGCETRFVRNKHALHVFRSTRTICTPFNWSVRSVLCTRISSPPPPPPPSPLSPPSPSVLSSQNQIGKGVQGSRIKVQSRGPF